MFFKVIFILCIGFVTFSAGRLSEKAEAMEYLTRYGYMQNMNSNLSSVSDEKLVEALKKFQQYFHLQMTGKLDVKTSKMMQAPRCGMVDMESKKSTNSNLTILAFSRLGRPFEKKQISYAISKYTNRFSKAQVDDTMRKAFAEWSKITGLTFTQRQPGQRVDIDIAFAKRQHSQPSGRPHGGFDGPGRVLAHALAPNVNAFLHFDDDENFTLNGGRLGINLFQVALHEIGHNIGLGHSQDGRAIMFPTIKFMQNVRLQADDINGAKTLYPQRRRN